MFSDPHHIASQLHIQPGSSVADLGAGTGVFSLALAQHVGPTGKVFACEVQKDFVLRIMNEAREHGLANIQAVHANIEIPQGTKLRDASIDMVVVANTLFQIEHRDNFVQEVSRILKPGGTAVIIDWSESFGNLGPHVRQVLPESEAVTLFTTHGFNKMPQQIDAGAHHYGVIFKK